VLVGNGATRPLPSDTDAEEFRGDPRPGPQDPDDWGGTRTAQPR